MQNHQTNVARPWNPAKSLADRQLFAKALDVIGKYFGTGPAGPMNPGAGSSLNQTRK